MAYVLSKQNRRDLTPSQRAKIEAMEQPEAKKRQGRPGAERSGKLPEHTEAGRTRDKVGAALGISGKTYEKIKQVTVAAEKEPEKFADLPAVMEEKSVGRRFGQFARSVAPLDRSRWRCWQHSPRCFHPLGLRAAPRAVHVSDFVTNRFVTN